MVACPKCNGELDLPEGANKDLIFDCPHCQASFPISESLLNISGDDGPFLFDLNADDANESEADPELDLEPVDDELDLDLNLDAEDRPAELASADVPAAGEIDLTAKAASDEIDELDEFDLGWNEAADAGDELDSNSMEVESDFDAAELEAELFPDADREIDLEMKLQTASHEIETESDDVTSQSAADELSAAAEAALNADNADLVGVEDLTAHMVDDAIRSEPEEEAAVEVVKPFDLPPSPGQVPAKSFQPRIPRRSGGLFPAVLKFGIGGLLGLVLCQAGLWWIGNADPLGLAAQLPDSLSFLAPKQVRNPYQTLVANRPPSLDHPPASAAPEPEDTGESDGIDELESPAENPADRASAFPASEVLGDGRPVDPDVLPSSDVLPSKDTLSTIEAAALPTTEEPPSDDALPTNDVLPSAEAETLFATPPATAETPSVNEADDADDNVLETQQLPSLTTFGLTSEKELHRNDLGTALGEARGALNQLLDAGAARASREVREARMLDFYDAALKLAEYANHVGSDADPVLADVQGFVQSISKYGNVIGRAAARRLPDSPSNGVFLSGTITDQESLDANYQRIEVTLLGDRPRQYAVVTSASTAAGIGDRVFVLGVRVANPTLEISGLSSPIDGQVVWSDHIIPMQ